MVHQGRREADGILVAAIALRGGGNMVSRLGQPSAAGEVAG